MVHISIYGRGSTLKHVHIMCFLTIETIFSGFVDFGSMIFGLEIVGINIIGVFNTSCCTRDRLVFFFYRLTATA